MTFKRLKDLSKFFLTGDIFLPEDEDIMIAGVQAALYHVAIKANALTLLTEDTNSTILRQGPGNYWIREPELPKNPTDEIDIDDELGQAVARYVCSFMASSIDMKKWHATEAEKIIQYYNSKTDALVENMEHKNELEHPGEPGYIREGLY